MKKEKVYCNDCRHYIKRVYTKFNITIPEVCTHNKNTVRDHSGYYLWKKGPEVINKKNNCKWFEEKEPTSGFWKKLFGGK